MDYYPDNTLARYTTKLTNTVELEGEWEVGLAEISFPSEVENVIGVTATTMFTTATICCAQ